MLAALCQGNSNTLVSTQHTRLDMPIRRVESSFDPTLQDLDLSREYLLREGIAEAVR